MRGWKLCGATERDGHVSRGLGVNAQQASVLGREQQGGVTASVFTARGRAGLMCSRAVLGQAAGEVRGQWWETQRREVGGPSC